MTVSIYTLKRICRNKLTLGLILVIPALAIGVLFGVAGDPYSDISVGIVDQDQTPLTAMLSDYLEDSFPVSELEEGQITGALAAGDVDYALVIDAGFTGELINHNMPALRGYSIQETNLARPVKHKIESYLGAANSIALTANDSAAFYRGMADFNTGSFGVKVQAYSDSDVEKSSDGAIHSMGFLAMTMLFFSAMAAVNLVEDRNNRTYFRILASPVSIRSYIFQKIISFFFLLLVMVFVVFLVVQLLFDLYLGPLPLDLFLVMAFFALLCVSMSVALAGLTRTTQQVGTASTLAIMPMTMLGGLFWPREIMPGSMQVIGEFLPTTWVMRAAGTVIVGNPLSSAFTELAVLSGFILVFFVLGSWRQKDIAF